MFSTIIKRKIFVKPHTFLVANYCLKCDLCKKIISAYFSKCKFSTQFFHTFFKRKLKFAHPGVDLRSSRGGHIEFDHVHKAAHLTAPV
jgi:hypothetical protein